VPQRKYKAIVVLMQANGWVPWVFFIPPETASIGELPILSTDGEESDMELSEDKSGSKGEST